LSLPEYFFGIKALVDIAKIFKVPIVITSTDDEGVEGPVLSYILDNLPDTKIINRLGEIDAFDNPDFKKAV
jgi:hypothetical protein